MFDLFTGKYKSGQGRKFLCSLEEAMNKEDSCFYKRLFSLFALVEFLLIGNIVFLVFVKEEQFFFDVAGKEEYTESPQPRLREASWQRASDGVQRSTQALFICTIALLFSLYQYRTIEWVSYQNDNTEYEGPEPIRIGGFYKSDDEHVKVIEGAVKRLEKEIDRTEKTRANVERELYTADDQRKKKLESRLRKVQERERKNNKKLETIERVVSTLKSHDHERIGEH